MTPQVGERYTVTLDEFKNAPWSGTFTLRTESGFVVAFTTEPLDALLCLQSPCCAVSLMRLAPYERAHCSLCGRSTIYPISMVNKSANLLMPNMSELEILSFWADSFHPYGGFVLAQGVHGLVQAIRSWGAQYWTVFPPPKPEAVEQALSVSGLGKGQVPS